MAHDPRDPLTPEEATLARIYAALPGGEPPPALDARVLAQARAAVQPAQHTHTRRRPRPWFLMPGMGAAAAAVMAAGLAWQMGWMGDGSGMHEASAPTAQAPAPAAAMQKNEAEERVDIEYLRGQAAPEVQDVQADTASSATRERTAAAPAKPAPASARAPAPAEAKQRQEFTPDPAPALEQEATPMSVTAPPPAPPAPAPAATAADAAVPAASMSGGTALQQRLDASPATTLPPWQQDAQLPPDAWLARVRERVQQGDRQSAIFSLRRFVLAHPRHAVPADLQRLLVR